MSFADQLPNGRGTNPIRSLCRITSRADHPIFLKKFSYRFSTGLVVPLMDSNHHLYIQERTGFVVSTKPAFRGRVNRKVKALPPEFVHDFWLNRFGHSHFTVGKCASELPNFYGYDHHHRDRRAGD